MLVTMHGAIEWDNGSSMGGERGGKLYECYIVALAPGELEFLTMARTSQESLSFDFCSIPMTAPVFRQSN